ncbi:MAG: hypothetical protein O7D30_01635, partial [Rickettsia endosymbiont of Ixodes persulcatus]|nr:hypothetical protein [Rickettsia endosymbiont of Ixodes persulcatus]
VGKHRDEKKLRNYVKNQGADRPSYKAFHQKQLKLFLDTSQLCCEEYHLIKLVSLLNKSSLIHSFNVLVDLVKYIVQYLL